MKNLNSVSNEINNIFNIISSGLKENEVAVRETPAQGTSALGIINVYDRAVLAQWNGKKSEKPVPDVRYVFYPTIGDSNRLGSVAIYTEYAAARQYVLSRVGTLFGRRILKATLEFGRRPYVDVRLAV